MSSRALACRNEEDPQGVLAWFESLATVISLTIRQPSAGRPQVPQSRATAKET